MKNAEVAFHRFRFDSPFQQGFEAGGRLLVDAALVLERDDRTISATSSKSDGEIADAASQQEFVVENWARQDGCWIVDPHNFYREKNYRFYGYGGEAQVYSEEDNFVHKICRIGQYDDLAQFFERIVIENTICPPAFLEVEGYSRLNEDFCVLLKQRFFRQKFLMSEEDITSYMQKLGFYGLKDESYPIIRYYSDSVIAEDLHPGNIWMTEEGNVVIIDGAFRFNVRGTF